MRLVSNLKHVVTQDFNNLFLSYFARDHRPYSYCNFYGLVCLTDRDSCRFCFYYNFCLYFLAAGFSWRAFEHLQVLLLSLVRRAHRNLPRLQAKIFFGNLGSFLLWSKILVRIFWLDFARPWLLHGRPNFTEK